MTRTPPALASSGMISGVGLAMAKTMASLFMVLHSSVVRMPGLDTPMKTSAPARASFRPPLIWRGLVTSPSQFLWASALLQPLYRVPNWSTATMSLAPAVISILMMAVPAAPGPFRTMCTSSIFLPTTRSALMRAAVTTMAVPCWSSWKTGMSSSRSKVSSISKHSGLLMSSRLMPPKVGAMALHAAMTLAASWASMQMGKASTPPNSLNSTALPSMTGSPASGPMSPRPSTAVPLDTTATMLLLKVYLYTSSGFSLIFRQGSATPGVYAVDRSSRVLTSTLLTMPTLPWWLSCISRAALL